MAQKQVDSLKVGVFEILCLSLFILGLVFNYLKTRKMGSTYDRLNITARDYTLKVELSDQMRYEFSQYEQRHRGPSRGYLFNQFLRSLLDFEGISILRIE